MDMIKLISSSLVEPMTYPGGRPKGHASPSPKKYTWGTHLFFFKEFNELMYKIYLITMYLSENMPSFQSTKRFQVRISF